jgi:hypothetical protein
MSDWMTTWRKEFESERERNKDATPVVAIAPDESVLDVEFDASWGRENGQPVLIWTEDYVYFPVGYDGSESLGSAPRNPRAEGQSHVGGG